MSPGLVCPACDRTYADRWRCTCGEPLDFQSTPRPDGPAPSFSAFDSRRGLWAFDDFLPVTDRVTLGEGFTPLVDAPDRNASFKLEYVSPTGSFKDRGAATVISRAVDLGVDRVIEDSSGNAGAAIAAYAARAGLDADIYVPASVADAKRRAIEAVGARVVDIEGDREAVAAACWEAVEDGGWYASHAWNPAFFAGTATFGLELAAQRDWSVPDAVVVPLGHGTMLLGAYRGFRALVEAGWTDTMPRLLAVQAAGYAPIAGDTGPATNDLADGIQVREPVRRGSIVDAIETTDGDAIAVSADAVRRAHAALRAGGFDVEPTAAAAVAGLRQYRERGVLDADADVVVPLTGRGK
ncbi:pyridoxal-phosphate dependent enzyme [Haloplanus aerogenes]|uniref:Pyridoxal-phosphate dependent enzyme n=1 Tax=Haloplanus aerogenes TaxID=660522 RepID=A0A3M0DRT6_9EURY|nr:pyridoxal-phosphate dependent enzyme [Haloplanus aerogenes]AZH24264.1 pyridoxal-phosphate dependent enzyme [Haloplanus aerogenes]RMB24105.1 threonine synthase [Haloplanus aerogenes]